VNEQPSLVIPMRRDETQLKIPSRRAQKLDVPRIGLSFGCGDWDIEACLFREPDTPHQELLLSHVILESTFSSDLVTASSGLMT
jgi:hypothetical protein